MKKSYHIYMSLAWPKFCRLVGLFNHEQMMWFSYRIGILEFRKRFAGKYKTTECIYECGEQDTLEHSFECDYNPVTLRGKSDSDMLVYLKALHEERLKTIGTGLYWL